MPRPLRRRRQAQVFGGQGGELRQGVDVGVPARAKAEVEGELGVGKGEAAQVAPAKRERTEGGASDGALAPYSRKSSSGGRTHRPKAWMWTILPRTKR